MELNWASYNKHLILATNRTRIIHALDALHVNIVTLEDASIFAL